MPSPGTLRHSPLGVLCLAYVSIGVPMGMLGAGWPEGRHLFERSTGSLGLVAGGFMLGRLATATSALPILRRWRIGPALGVLAGGLAVAATTVALTRSFAVLVAAFTGVGLTSGALDALGNRYQTVIRHVGRAGLMFGSFGIGSTVGPVVIGLAGWTPAFLAAAALAATTGLLVARPAVRWPDEIRRSEPPHGDHSRIHVRPAVVIVSLSLFAVYCGMEVTTGTWGASYLQEHRGVDDHVAAWAMSGFWAGLTVGRLGMGLVAGPGRPLTPGRLLLASGALALFAYGLLPVVPVPATIALVAVGGLALAGMFPTLMSTTADRVGVGAAGRVMGWQLVAANVSELALAAMLGGAVDRYGPGAPAAVLAGLAVVGLPLLVWSSRWHEVDRGAHASPGASQAA